MPKKVSQILREKHDINLKPGSERGECPYCHQLNTFGITRDDRSGRCFHPACGKVLVVDGANRDVNIMHDILGQVYSDCRQALFAEKRNGTQGAHSYLVDKRKVHPRVVMDAMLGAVPEKYDVEALFGPYIKEEDEEIWKDRKEKGRGRPSKEKSLAELRLEFLQSAQEKLSACFKGTEGWLCFFYTDSRHRIVAIRIREPYSKDMRMFKPHPHIMGVCGYGADESGSLIVMEGEFNQLQLQSLAVRNEEATGESSEYFNAVAVGGVSNADYETIRRIDRMPIICYDNDESGGGFSLVSKARELMSVYAMTTPRPYKDMDEYILSLGDDYGAAYGAVMDLINEKKTYFRAYESLEGEIHTIRQKRPERGVKQEFEVSKDVARSILSDLRDRGKLYTDGKESYLFLHEDKRLVYVDGRDDGFRLLMHRYGVNRSEALYKYLTAAIDAEARQRGEKTSIYRLSHYDSDIFTLYLHNNDSLVYRITCDGVELIDNGSDKVLFVNNPDTEPFIYEATEDDTKQLDEQVISQINFGADELTPGDRRILFKLWLMSVFFDTIFPTRPILALLGEHGSGKTTIGRILLLLIFGKNADVTSLREADDFDTAVGNNHLVVFDNVDDKRAWLNDKLAIAATGGNIRKRKLYTDNSEVVIPIQSSIAITSRTPHFDRADVSERLLLMKLTRLDTFMAESRLLKEVYENRTRLMSELIEDLQKALTALRDNRHYDVKGFFRMADFYDFSVKVSKYQGREDEVKNIFRKLSRVQSNFSLENDPIFLALKEWAIMNPGREVEPSVLGSELTRLASARKIELESPLTGNKMGHWLSQEKLNVDVFCDVAIRQAGSRKKFYSFRLKED